MTFLIVSSVVTFLTGLFLFFAGDAVKKLSDVLNLSLVRLDEALISSRIATGIILLLLGGWILYTGIAHTVFWYLILVGGLIVIFGLLYLFCASCLGAIAQVTDRIMLSTDDLVFHGRRITGVVLILISLYLFYTAFQIK